MSLFDKFSMSDDHPFITVFGRIHHGKHQDWTSMELAKCEASRNPEEQLGRWVEK